MQEAPLRFSDVGPGLKLQDDRLSVSKTDHGYAFTLAAPALHSGSASASFRLGYTPNDEWGVAIGVFPANMELDSYIYSTAGKRCALLVHGGSSRVACDGAESDHASGLGWKEGDSVHVNVAFEGETARVTLRAKEKTWRRVLRDVPACGLCIGVGLYD